MTLNWRVTGGRGIRRAVRRELVTRMVRESAPHRKNLRWHAIFNARVRSVSAFDGSREMVYGKIDKNNSTEHTSQPLPALRDWGRCVMRVVRTALADGDPTGGPKVRLADLGYVRTNASVPQHWHRDVPVKHRGAAYSVFMPVNIICPRTDPGAFQWRHLNDESKLVHGMLIENPGDVFLNRAIQNQKKKKT